MSCAVLVVCVGVRVNDVVTTAFYVLYLSETLAEVTAEGPNVPVVSRVNGKNSYVAVSRSRYLAIFLASMCLAVLPGPPASKYGW